MKRYIRLILQVLIAFVIFTSLSAYLSNTVLILVIIAIIIVYIVYGNRGHKNYTYYLDVSCDVDKYLEYIKTKLENKNDLLYKVYTAYGNLFNGEFDNLEVDINNIDYSLLNDKEKLLVYEIKLKVLYYNKDIIGYTELLKEISEKEYTKSYSNNILVLEIPLYLLKEEYTELVDILFELIPKQRESYRVIELEYYLAIAYVAIGKEEDAVAVLEFVTKRDFKLYQVVKGKELLETLKSN